MPSSGCQKCALRSEEHTSELQSHDNLVFRLLLEKNRDRVTFGMIVGVPLMQIMLFGYAITFDVRHLATVVQDQAHTAMSRELFVKLTATQVVHVISPTDSSAE